MCYILVKLKKKIQRWYSGTNLVLILVRSVNFSLDFIGLLFRLKKHKEGCLCAICVMIRRRQEREETTRLLDDQGAASDDGMKAEVLIAFLTSGLIYFC